MPNSQTRVRLSIALCIAILALPGCGKSVPVTTESMGEITGKIVRDDKPEGTEITWHAVGVHDSRGWHSRNNWFGEQQQAGAVTLFGQLAIDMEQTSASLMIRFDVREGAVLQDSVKIRYFIDGIDKYSFASKGEGSAAVQLETVELDGKRMHVQGSFQSILPFRRKGKSHTNNVRKIDGEFDVLLPIVRAT